MSIWSFKFQAILENGTEWLDFPLYSDAVPPAYYAHLAAFRARFYMEPDMQENGSTGGGSAGHGSKGTRIAGECGVRPLPALKENVKRVMFYC